MYLDHDQDIMMIDLDLEIMRSWDHEIMIVNHDQDIRMIDLDHGIMRS